jgi:hypothetical protein
VAPKEQLAVVKQTTASGLLEKFRSVETPTPEMAPPRKLKKDERGSSSTAMELQIRKYIARLDLL